MIVCVDDDGDDISLEYDTHWDCKWEAPVLFSWLLRCDWNLQS
jgi:hypothetical protein